MDGHFSLFLPRLEWFKALFSLFFLSVYALVDLQGARPWELRFCSS
jgi:hypothetical protein